MSIQQTLSTLILSTIINIGLIYLIPLKQLFLAIHLKKLRILLSFLFITIGNYIAISRGHINFITNIPVYLILYAGNFFIVIGGYGIGIKDGNNEK
ncbi:hypothetical protein SAMN05446037_10553 [Anaerovirgula multivorans]|uniref:Uncharacterized protein n=1 Tax=Anaerovirgula multivorans TaxID=312168 RepID=A0A239KV35_9FIRM|nr:hypothetical protein [Anaerovirgula multivorans]SNT21880.1 hypothetical protein SAMN05446037_10553 [Anaerovirgula multivorans]